MQSISIPTKYIHSMADIITNSSTEVYIMANGSTIKGIKALVDSLLKLAKSTLTCDDLFTVNYDVDTYIASYWEDDYDEEGFYDWDQEESSPEKGSDEHRAMAKAKFIEEFMRDDWYYDGDSFRDRYILVRTKDDSEEAAEAAKLLSNLHNLFETEASSNY